MRPNLPLALAFGLGVILLHGSVQGAPAPSKTEIESQVPLLSSSEASKVKAPSPPKVDQRSVDLGSISKSFLNLPLAELSQPAPGPAESTQNSTGLVSTGSGQETVTGLNWGALGDGFARYQINFNRRGYGWHMNIDVARAITGAASWTGSDGLQAAANNLVGQLNIPTLTLSGGIDFGA